MGWSCDREAGELMNKIFSLAKEGLIYNGEEFFLEPSSKEYDDGRILIHVYKIIDKTKQLCVRVGSFYILPSGKISQKVIRKFPFLKKVV